MFLKNWGIHIFNVVGALVLVLIVAYYSGAFDSIYGTFRGFEGQWDCDVVLGKMKIDAELKVWLRANPNQRAGTLQKTGAETGIFTSSDLETALKGDPLEFKGFGSQLGIQKTSNGNYHFWCHRLKFLESY